MGKLLNAELQRLFREPFFYALAVLPLLPVVPLLFLRRYIDNIQLILVFAAFFTAFTPSVLLPHFIGMEYSGGTIRNKLMIGGKRPQIYLSFFIIGMIPALLIFALNIAVIAAGSLFGGFKDSLGSNIGFIACAACALCVISAVCAVLSAVIQSKAISTAVSLVINFGALLFTFATENYGNTANELQYIMYKIGSYLPWAQVNGHIYQAYLYDKAYETAINTPGLSTETIVGGIIAGHIAVDIIIIVTVTAAGLLIFRKRDIK